VPALTVLWHPEAHRVGERAVLVDVAHGNGQELSRSTPLFGAPGATPTEPLAEVSVSRTPILLRRAALGVTLSCDRQTKLKLDGQRVPGSIYLSEDALSAGVVLELSSDVCVVLHLYTPRSSEVPLDGWVGASDSVQRVREQVLTAASHDDVSVLVCGESGTGKELVAQALHRHSPRAQRPFVAVNMGSLGASMAASALFGHKKGAFTGASNNHPGCFDTAHGGTLFLDEVGATPVEVQPLLLRALETGEIQSLGAARPHHVDVRVVAATDANLPRAVVEDRFQLALLHRLRGYELQVPPLRQRREDIGVLLRHYLQQELARQGREGILETPSGAVPWLAAAQVAQLARYDFPGNVRELKNFACALAIDWAFRPQVGADAIQQLCRQPSPAQKHAVSGMIPTHAASNSAAFSAAAPRTSELTREELLAALEASDWSPDGAAERLRLSRTTVYAWMKRLSLIIAKELDAEQIRGHLVQHAGDVAAAARGLQVSERALRLRIEALRDGTLIRLIRTRRS
jgi:two-component system, NtrC family, nitrogen regulation response regulator GlnG